MIVAVLRVRGGEAEGALPEHAVLKGANDRNPCSAYLFATSTSVRTYGLAVPSIH